MKNCSKLTLQLFLIEGSNIYLLLLVIAGKRSAFVFDLIHYCASSDIQSRVSYYI